MSTTWSASSEGEAPGAPLARITTSRASCGAQTISQEPPITVPGMAEGRDPAVGLRDEAEAVIALGPIGFDRQVEQTGAQPIREYGQPRPACRRSSTRHRLRRASPARGTDRVPTYRPARARCRLAAPRIMTWSEGSSEVALMLSGPKSFRANSALSGGAPTRRARASETR